MKTNAFANPLAEKIDAYNSAISMLAKQEDNSLRYAALELRRCLEAIVYEKLRIYGDLLPEGSVHQWQPAQAFEALLAIEPLAEETTSFAVGLQESIVTPSEGPFVKLGDDERPKAKWLKHRWNKLGSYLHAEWPFSKTGKEISSARAFLEKAVEEVQPFAESHFSCAMLLPVEFSCLCCKLPVKALTKAVESAIQKGLSIPCLTCGTRYRVENLNGDYIFHPVQTPFTCDCGVSTYVPERQVKLEYMFSCRSCGKEFKVTGVQWTVELVVGKAHPSEPDE